LKEITQPVTVST